jgi:hypothetical protein
VGASLAGLALGVYPSRKLRVSISLYAIFRALEFGWNCAEDNGMVWGWEKGINGKPDRKRARPSWWGSWMLQPLAFGQLFHALVFDRDCFPSVSEIESPPDGRWANPRLSRFTAILSLITPPRTYTPSRKSIPLVLSGPRPARLSKAWPRWRASTGREFPPFPF